jgi:hypothetical protein
MNPEKNSIFQGWVSCANFSIHFQATVFQPCIRAFHITTIPMIANSHLDCRGFLIHTLSCFHDMILARIKESDHHSLSPSPPGSPLLHHPTKKIGTAVAVPTATHILTQP